MKSLYRKVGRNGREFFNKKIPSVIICFLITLLFLGVLLSSSTQLQLGNVFFGKVPKLYNITLAHFFFRHASYPLFGKAVPYAHYQLSRTNFIQGKLNTAINEAQKELEFYPENKRTYYILGLTYGYMNQEVLAIENFEKFIEWKPESWAARNDKAWLQFRIGDIDGALSTVEPVVHDINNPWIQNTYGTLLMNKKEYVMAKTAYLHAQRVTDTMTLDSWGAAYPGNDPKIYSVGLSAMKQSIKSNLELLAGK